MNNQEFTIKDALEIQAQNLIEWKTVLNETSYNLLKLECERRNLEGYNTPYRVFRGQDLPEFVINLAVKNK